MLGARTQRPPRLPLLLAPGGWDAVRAAAAGAHDGPVEVARAVATDVV